MSGKFPHTCRNRLAALSLLLSATLAAQTAPTTINLATTTSPAAAQPGVTVVTLTCSGLPAGTITTASLSVTLKVAAGSTGPNLTANVTAFASLAAAAGRITFQVNGSGVSAPTPYIVSVSGTTSTGNSFASGSPASLTVNPAASILSLNPSSGLPGQSLSIAITGQYTNFVHGSTTVSFGAGISVGGVTVTSPTTATAQITIDSAASAGLRSITVATGVQQASLAGGFTVTGNPAITSLNPSTGPAGADQFPSPYYGAVYPFLAKHDHREFGAGITVVSLTVNSLTNATAVLNIDAAAAAGPRTVTLTTSTETASIASGFTVIAPGNPAITLLTPNTAQQGQANLPVTITGQNTHFVAGVTQVSFGSGITVASVSVANSTTLTANITIGANATAGAYTVAVTTGNETESLTNGFTVQQGPPVITLTAPTNLSYLNISPTTVNGTVSDPTATVVVNSIAAPVANGAFSIQLPLAEGPNQIVATATSKSGLVTTATVQATLDTTPPHVTITSPTDQLVTTAASISVSGNVNDIVVGTVNAQQAQVRINGTAAQVANRTFLAANIPLSLGANVLHATAVDQAGNAATTQITVTRQAPPAQPQIQLISGNIQTGVIGTLLPTPLIAKLTDSSGNPVASTPVIFQVTQNNGMLTGSGCASFLGSSYD